MEQLNITGDNFRFAFKSEDSIPQKIQKTPIYTLGSADPRCFAVAAEARPAAPAQTPESHREAGENGYNSFGGTDVKVFIDDEVVGPALGIGFGYRDGFHPGSRVPGGSLLLVLFDRMDHVKWLGKTVHLALVAANEYGKICTIYNARVKFDEHEQFGVSIDDIVVEIRIDFTLVERSYEDFIPPNQRKEHKDATGEVPASTGSHGC